MIQDVKAFIDLLEESRVPRHAVRVPGAGFFALSIFNGTFGLCCSVLVSLDDGLSDFSPKLSTFAFFLFLQRTYLTRSGFRSIGVEKQFLLASSNVLDPHLFRPLARNLIKGLTPGDVAPYFAGDSIICP